jgi:hypothetical protein
LGEKLKSKSHTGIAVIEARWWKDFNTSVRGCFDLLADNSCDNPHGYHYEMVGSKEAILEAIARIARVPRYRVLYIATHGNAKSIELHNNDELGRASLRKCLASGDRKRLDGVHFSTCGFCSNELAKFLFEKDVCVDWVAGYDAKKIDWIDSAALDMIFFNEWIAAREEHSPSQAIRAVANNIRKRTHELIKELGFGIYVRHSGGARNLLDEAAE